MTEKVFDRETILDLTVNFIPLGILVVFFFGYLVFNPFGFDSVLVLIQLSIIGLSAILLGILTYYSGAAVSKAETETESALEDDETSDLDASEETAAETA